MQALTSIARVESGFAPLLIGVSGPHRSVVRPTTKAEAVETASELIAAGRDIDLGLAQINSRNLAALDMSVEDAFDSCRNLAAAGRILDRGYERALITGQGNRPILQMAYSIYNTGNTDDGLRNGYVARVEAARREDSLD